MPQPVVRDAGGGEALLDDVLGPGFALIGLGVSVSAPPPPGWPPLRALCLRRDDSSGPDPAGALVLDDALETWWPLAAGQVLLVRPDRFVFAVAAAGGVHPALRELAAALGLPPAAHVARIADR